MAAFFTRRACHLFNSTKPRLWFSKNQNGFIRETVASFSAAKLKSIPEPKETPKNEETMKGHFSLKPRKAEESQDKLKDLLRKVGVEMKNLEKKIDVKKLSFQKVKNLLNFLEEIGIEGERRGKIITRRPGILTAKEYLIKLRVQTMRNVGINPEAVVYVVRESPGVLTGKTEESLPEKVKFFEKLAVKPKFTKDEILHVLTKCPDIIAAYTVELLDVKFQFLANELKFNKHHLKNLILKQPSVLTFSKEAILEKYKYCYEKMNLSPSCIARCPRVFQCSLQRIRERHGFLKHLGYITEETRMDDYGLGLIVTTSEKQFAERVAKTTMAEFDRFKRDMNSRNDSIEGDDKSNQKLPEEEENIYWKSNA